MKQVIRDAEHTAVLQTQEETVLVLQITNGNVNVIRIQVVKLVVVEAVEQIIQKILKHVMHKTAKIFPVAECLLRKSENNGDLEVLQVHVEAVLVRVFNKKRI